MSPNMSENFISLEAISRRFAHPQGGGTTTVFEDIWPRASSSA